MVSLAKKLWSPLFRWARKYRAGLIISTTVCFLSLSLYGLIYLVARPSPLLHFLADIELRTLDMRFQLRGPLQPDQSIVIVAIDQKSQDVLGRWPFPRSAFAKALDFFHEAQTRVVVFDVDFPQPDENSALLTVRQVRKEYESLAPSARAGSFAGSLKRFEADADNDQKFAAALSRFENAVLGYFMLPPDEALTENQARVNEFLNYLSFQAYPQLVHPEYGKLFEGLQEYAISPDLPQLAQYARNFGFFNVIPDPDGTVRREPVAMRLKGSFYPSLDVAAALAYTNRPLEQVAVVFNPNGLERIDFGPLAIPTDPGGFAQIDFHGPRGTYATYSLSDVVLGKLPKALFRDRLVLIGPTATGIADNAVTPYDKVFPGVEVHANFIDDLLDGHFIKRGLRENLIDIAFILVFSLGAGILLTIVPPARATFALVASLGIYLWLAHYLFAHFHVWIAAFLPTATLTLNYGGIVSYRFFFEEREKKKVRGAFGQYVAPGVINQLMEHPEQLRLGGEERELTAMFTDIRGFTTISEGLSPEALVDLLNEYLSEMTEIIFHEWGTLDKYIGDAIMAFWGAPFPQRDHAARACRAALEMLAGLRRLQERWKQEGRPRINIGIGINTGVMLVGNLGSKRRFNFTIMGDNVNLASRLEGLNKQFVTRAIISESTYQAVRDHFVGRELDLIRVKGKTKPVKVYELLGSVAEAGQFQDLMERFNQGIELYRTTRWEAAIEQFEGLVRDYPDDGPSGVFLHRCQDLLVQPPESAWDGVYVMKSK